MHLKINIKGEFKLLIRNKETNEIKLLVPYQDNVITDEGLSGLVTDSIWVYKCHVGTDDTPIQLNDEGVRNSVASVRYTGVPVNECKIVDDYVYYSSTYKFVFNNLNGQPLKEIGIDTYTRALIGSSFPIEVQSDEYLEVYYRLITKVLKTPVIYDMELEDKFMGEIEQTTNMIMTVTPRAIPIQVGGKFFNSKIRVGELEVDPQYHLESPRAPINTSPSLLRADYVDDSNIHILIVFVRDISEIRSIFFPLNLGYFAVQFDPKVTRDPNEHLQLIFNLEVSRAT